MPPGTYAREGLRIKLDRIEDLTDSGVLTEPYYFQCPPRDEWGIDHGFGHSIYDTIYQGQHSRRGGRELRRSSWTSLAVDTGVDDRGMPTPSFVTLSEFKAIEDLTDELVSICESGSPFLYTVAHQFPSGFQNWALTLAGPEAQWPAVMTRIRVSEVAGEGDTRYFDMDFQEYRDPVVGRSALGKRGGGKGSTKFPAFAVLRPDGFAYDSVTGRRMGNGTPATLTQLARHYYRDGSAWRGIAKANGMTNVGGSDPLVWTPSQRGVLVLTSGRTHKLTVPGDPVTGETVVTYTSGPRTP